MEKNSEVANEVTDAQRRTMLWSKQKPEIKLEPRAYDVNNNIQIFSRWNYWASITFQGPISPTQPGPDP